LSVVTLVTVIHLSPSSSVVQVCDSCLSEEIHSKGSWACELGITMGTMGKIGRFGMIGQLVDDG